MPAKNQVKNTRKGRVAIVGGLRTPFLKSSTHYTHMYARDLASRLTAELIARKNLSAKDIDRVVFGQVVPDVAAPNIAREVVLQNGMPHNCDGYSVVRACATGTQAIVDGAQAILSDDTTQVVICGGADSLSNPPITYSKNVVKALIKASQARSPMDKAKALLKIRPQDLLPTPPALRELSTGLTMGQSAEKMAKENCISRSDQDEIALASHLNAAKAWDDIIFQEEVMAFPCPPKFAQVAEKDGLIRGDTSMEKLAKLRPVFDKKFGSITAGNSSPLTDGAAAVILMAEDRAKALGFKPLAYIRAWAFSGCDPNWQLLQGPAFAAPMAMKSAGLALKDLEYIDMHEAFAAQVLSNVQAFESASFAKKHLGGAKPLGKVKREKLNIHGGSISLGHPFAATGARQALTMARALERNGGGTALITQCAAGGLGAALILENA